MMVPLFAGCIGCCGAFGFGCLGIAVCFSDNESDIEVPLTTMIANRFCWIIGGALTLSWISRLKNKVDHNFAALDEISDFEW